MATKHIVKVKNSISTIRYDGREVRLLLWGGAYEKGNNDTFHWAMERVIKNYESSDHDKYKITPVWISSGDDLIKAVSEQRKNNIHSLDIFTHGGSDGLYMVSVRSEDDGKFNPNHITAYRYALHNTSFYRSDLIKLPFDRFTEDAKIEIHGCNAAATDTGNNNITADFSRYLHEAGKNGYRYRSYDGSKARLARNT